MSILHPSSLNTPEEREEKLRETINNLPKKLRGEPKRNTLLALTIRIHADLREALAKGYSYEELATLIHSEFDRVISPETLRKYMNQAAKIGKQSAARPDVNQSLSQPFTSELLKPLASAPLQVDEDKYPRRDTLYSQGTNAHAKSDEFENL